MISEDTQPLVHKKQHKNISSVLNIHSQVGEKVEKGLDQYLSLFDETESTENLNNRQKQYKSFVSSFYDLVTDFYEYGWGESFHFAPRNVNETLEQAISRHEHYIALRLGLKPGMRVLDAGCGVGGPARAIARFSGAKIEGVTICQYQIERAIYHTETQSMEKLCSFFQGDFLNVDRPDEYYDAIYSIEATCHAPTRDEVFGEMYRLLKPGGMFCSYEWCMTDKYDPNNPKHVEIKKGIEYGNGLPEMITTKETLESLKRVGFEILEATDFGIPNAHFSIPWYNSLENTWSIKNFLQSKVGRSLSNFLVSILEKLGIAPKGSTKTSELLMTAADRKSVV